MRIAVASDGLDVSMHNCRCASYMCYTVDRGVITGCQNTPNPCVPTELSAEYLDALGVDVFIVNDMKPQSMEPFARHGIEVVAGKSGPARQVAERYVAELFSGDDDLALEGA